MTKEELLTRVFYIVWAHKPVDVPDLAIRLREFDSIPEVRDGGKMFFSRLAAQGLLQEIDPELKKGEGVVPLPDRATDPRA